MAKIMLVEDDNNLREIYEARLIAEGYEIVSAKDGEEALALAVKEKPDLIISDVMMPKISGFDMLDILRTTPETKNTKIIMMTALSQAEDKSRADKLGADRYLVKSQVTLEDVAAVAREVLTGEPAPAVGGGAATASTTTDDTTATAPEPVATAATPDPATTAPVADDSATTSTPADDSTTSTTTDNATSSAGGVEPNLSQTAADESKAIDEQINSFVSTAPSTEPPAPEPEPEAPKPAPAPEPSDPVEEINVAQAPPDSTAAAADNAAKLADAVNDLLQKPEESAAPSTDTTSNESADTATENPTAADSASNTKKVIQPLNDPTTSAPDLNALLQQEELKAAGTPAVTAAPEPAPADNIAITPDGEIKAPETSADTASVPVAEPPASTDPNSPNNIAL